MTTGTERVPNVRLAASVTVPYRRRNVAVGMSGRSPEDIRISRFRGSEGAWRRPRARFSLSFPRSVSLYLCSSLPSSLPRLLRPCMLAPYLELLLACPLSRPPALQLQKRRVKARDTARGLQLRVFGRHRCIVEGRIGLPQALGLEVLSLERESRLGGEVQHRRP